MISISGLPGKTGLLRLALLLAAAAVFADPAAAGAVDFCVPFISAPLQQEKFFETESLSAGGETSPAPGLWEPQLGLSHAAREDEEEVGTIQTTHKIHGEAGGRLNLLDSVSLTAVAKVPLYTYETRLGQSKAAEGSASADIMRKPGSGLSLRSELGVSLGKGVDVNLFYDQSMFGRVDKPGVEERDERFGTRCIIRFK